MGPQDGQSVFVQQRSVKIFWNICVYVGIIVLDNALAFFVMFDSMIVVVSWKNKLCRGFCCRNWIPNYQGRCLLTKSIKQYLPNTHTHGNIWKPLDSFCCLVRGNIARAWAWMWGRRGLTGGMKGHWPPLGVLHVICSIHLNNSNHMSSRSTVEYWYLVVDTLNCSAYILSHCPASDIYRSSLVFSHMFWMLSGSVGCCILLIDCLKESHPLQDSPPQSPDEKSERGMWEKYGLYRFLLSSVWWMLWAVCNYQHRRNMSGFLRMRLWPGNQTGTTSWSMTASGWGCCAKYFCCRLLCSEGYWRCI